MEVCNKRRKIRNMITKQFELEKFARKSINYGPFRENIRCFLQDFAEIEDYNVNGMSTWRTLLVYENNKVFPLYTVEETVHEHSVRPFCDHCKLSGWGHHFVSKRKYHFIVPADDDWSKPLNRNFSELSGHNLYGLIHCNGYGHLIHINGFMEKSSPLDGSDIMDLWDRLCTALKARKISVYDILKKEKMEMRLIHGVAYGYSWYGKWGYKYSGGSFGVTEKKYEVAIDFLSGLGLDQIINHFKYMEKGRNMKQIIDKYRELSEKPLITVRDLLKFMLNAPTRKPNYDACEYGSKTEASPISLEKFVNSLAKSDSRWPARRLQHVLVVVIDLLKEYRKTNANRTCSMSRHELREGARKTIGDTGLIDFVLKSIKCFAVENQIIRRAINPSTRLLEFSIHNIEIEAESMSSPLECNCIWSRNSLEEAVQVVASILEENRGKTSMTHKELSNKAREQISDTRLIDVVLKSLDYSVVGNRIIYRSKNPSTKRIEFALQSNTILGKAKDFKISPFLKDELDDDVLFLYENVLLDCPMMNSVGLASQVVLESKQFMKEWQVDGHFMNTSMTLTCQVLPSFEELETEFNRPLSPGVIVTVHSGITVGDLKLVAKCALRDTYCVMDEFVVTQIGGLRRIEDERVLYYVMEPGSHVWVRGCGLDLDTQLRYEDGGNKSRVDRLCEACNNVVTGDACNLSHHKGCVNVNGDDDDNIYAPQMLV